MIVRYGGGEEAVIDVGEGEGMKEKLEAEGGVGCDR